MKLSDFNVKDDRETALECLNGLKAQRADNYDDWLNVGIALKNSGASCDDWDRWSRSSDKYQAGLCREKWDSFNGDGSLTVGSLIHWYEADTGQKFQRKKGTKKATPKNQTPSEFKDFIRLDRIDLPEFPIEALPEPIRTLSQEISASLQVPVDLPGLLALSAISLFAAGRYEVTPKPDWVEPLNIYMACILPAAKKKSQVFKIISEPILQIERELVQDSRELVERNRSDFAILEMKKKDLEKKTAKNSNSRLDLNEVLREMANFRHIYEPTLLASDVTPEAVSKLLCQNDAKLGIFSSEGGIFATFAGRYQDNKPVNDVFLKAHIGDTIRVNRVGRPSEHIEKPAITMALTIQPTIIEHLGHKRLLEDSGMLGRFLYSMPVCDQEVVFDTTPISDEIKRAYDQLLNTLHNNPNLRILRMPLTDSAVKLFEPFYMEIHQRLQGGDLACIASWAGKLCGHTLRIAALFELVERASACSLTESMMVSEKNVQGAIELSRYFIPHAKRTFKQMGQNALLSVADRIVQWILRTQVTSFSQRDVYEAIKGLSVVTTVMDVIEPLELLKEYGYIKSAEPKSGVGRKSTMFNVNPEVFEA